MTIAEAQQDMRYAYFGGSTGLLASALAWLISGVSRVVLSPVSGLVVLRGRYAVDAQFDTMMGNHA